VCESVFSSKLSNHDSCVFAVDFKLEFVDDIYAEFEDRE